MTGLVLDITRTIMRAAHASPTGIDRVERAYFEWALSKHDREVAFICRLRGWQAVIDRKIAQKVFEETTFRPRGTKEEEEHRRERRIRRLQSQLKTLLRANYVFRSATKGWFALRRAGIDPKDAIYVNVSHNNVDDWALTLIRRMGMKKIVVLLHDVIPVDFPEFVNKAGEARFAERLRAISKNADGLIFNSHFTEQAAMRWVDKFTRLQPKTQVAYLGINEIWDADYVGKPLSDTPYFVMLGTIEPRKNHLLILNVWRRLADEMENPPHLRVIGWRGWENENIIDFLDRSPLMGNCVFEHPSDSDEQVRAWVKGARALLYPSFVEGYGIPVVEALAAGTPVICSELSVLREVGGKVPEFIDPLDGPQWLQMIKAYAEPGSMERAGQIERMQGYEVPHWVDHFALVDDFLSDLEDGT
ncbi:MAG: glycosyltransferase family 1 protein [Pseudomonadota bacterium]